MHASRTHSQRLLWVLLVASMLALSACAQQVGDIDRTQPDKVEKSLFTGEWYLKHTVVEVPPSTGFTVAGSQSGFGERIVWEIQNDFLIARRAVEYRRNSEFGRGTSFDENADGTIEMRKEGAPVAVYRIQSHFDIQRQYNAATGEQSNVIVENTQDRPWDEREWMRVDWSQNLATDYFFLDDPNNYQYSSLAYFVSETDETNLDRPLIGEDYIEITGKWSVKPDTEYFGGSWGYIPSCWLSLATDCQEQVLKVMSSYAKRTADREMYNPREWDDVSNQKFQILRTWRAGHNDELGSPYTSTDYMANVYNIWIDESLPIADREVRPIVFYLSPNYPTDDAALMWGTEKTFTDWDNLFRDVAKAMGYPADKADAATFVKMCTNPVKADDDEICRTRVVHKKDASGNIVRADENVIDITRGGYIAPGDVRFNQMNMILQPQNYGRVLAFAQRLADIETGEVVSSTTHILYTTQEWANSRVVDYIQLLNGDLRLEDYISGKYVRDRIEDQFPPDGHTISPPKELAEIKPMLDLDNLVNIDARMAEGAQGIDRNDMIRGFERVQRDIRRVRDNGGPGIYEARRQKLAEVDQGQIEAVLRERMRQDTEFLPAERQPHKQLNDVLMPLSTSMRERSEALHAREKYMSERHMLSGDAMIENLNWPMMTPLAERFKGVPREQISEYIRAVGYYYTISHEIGHNMGLSHSFGSSTDALNFPEAYWLEKARAGFVPEYLLDEQARYELYDRNQELRANQYASIMDYASYTEMRDEYTSDVKGQRSGLGRSDVAAIAYAYGNLVEVFDANEVPDTYEWDQNRDGTVDVTINVNKSAIQFDPDIYAKAREYHYSYYPNFVFDRERIRVNLNDADLSFESLEVLPFDNSDWQTVVSATRDENGNIVVNQTQEGTAQIEEVLYTAAIAMSKGRRFVPETEVQANANSIEVPYRTCTNGLENRLEWCAMHDYGVDMWERVHAEIKFSDFYYYSSHFNRDVDARYVPFYYSWMATEREFGFIFNMHKHWINRALIELRPFDSYPENQGADVLPWYLNAAGGYDGFLASLEALEHWQKFMSRPSMPEAGYRIVQEWDDASQSYVEVPTTPGVANPTGAKPYLEKARFYLNTEEGTFMTRDRYNEDELDLSMYFDMDLGDARYLRTEFDPSLGYNFYYRAPRYGNWISKMVGVMMASDPYVAIVGADTGADASYALNLATLFRREVFEVLSGYMTGEPSKYTQGVMMDAEGPAVRPLTDAFTQLLSSFPPPNPDAYVMPEESFSAKLISLYYTAILFDLSSENPFADAMNVMIEGEDRAIPEGAVEGDDYLRVNDLRNNQTYVIFRHQRQDGLFIRRPLDSPTWDMAEEILDAYAQYGFNDADSYREALRQAQRDGDDDLERELEDLRFELSNNFEVFDRLRTLWFVYDFRYPSL